MNWCEEIATEEEDKVEERGTIMKVLEACGYPRWTVMNVKNDMEKKEKKKNGNKKQENDMKTKGMVVLPYVRGASEKLARIFKKRGIVTAMKPHSTLKSLLVHPKDKTDSKEGVYTIDCKSCDNKYIGETDPTEGVYTIDCCWQPSVMFNNGDCTLVGSLLSTAYPVAVKSNP